MPSVDAHCVVPGKARAQACRLEAPVSFYGGVGIDGTVVDVHHPQVGASLANRVLLMPAGKGSSSSSSSLAELFRADAGPAALVMVTADPIVALGAIVAQQLYGISVPIVTVDPDLFAALPDDLVLSVDASTDSATVSW